MLGQCHLNNLKQLYWISANDNTEVLPSLVSVNKLTCEVDVACYWGLIYLPTPTSFQSPRFLLPEYILDFGYVIPGKVLSHTVNVTNIGSVPVSFLANRKPLSGTGNTINYLSSCSIFSSLSLSLIKCDISGLLYDNYAETCVMMPQVFINQKWLCLMGRKYTGTTNI